MAGVIDMRATMAFVLMFVCCMLRVFLGLSGRVARVHMMGVVGH